MNQECYHKPFFRIKLNIYIPF